MVAEAQEAKLRGRLTRFLADSSKGHAGLRVVVETFSQRKWDACIFGGVLRDLISPGRFSGIRDVDLVVADVSCEDLEGAFSGFVERRTRFGGVHLKIAGWPFDVWPLRETWAFRQLSIGGGHFEDLPRTTFLNAEAVAAELITNPGRKRRVFDNGFYESISRQKLEINLEENPYPALCVARSLITAWRLRFSLGKRLARYIESYSQKIPLEELVEVQRSHYGYVVCEKQRLAAGLSAIREQLRAGNPDRVDLPSTRLQQLDLWGTAGQPASLH